MPSNNYSAPLKNTSVQQNSENVNIDSGSILQVWSKIPVVFPTVSTVTQLVSTLMHLDCKLSSMSQLRLLLLMHPSQFST